MSGRSRKSPQTFENREMDANGKGRWRKWVKRNVCGRAWEGGRGKTGVSEALPATWVGSLPPAPAPGCMETAVRTRTGCEGPIPPEEAKMDAGGGGGLSSR